MRLIRRGVRRSVKDLAKDITASAASWSADPKPYVWTKTADNIVDTLAAYCQRITDSATLERCKPWQLWVMTLVTPVPA